MAEILDKVIDKIFKLSMAEEDWTKFSNNVFKHVGKKGEKCVKLHPYLREGGTVKLLVLFNFSYPLLAIWLHFQNQDICMVL